MHLGISIATLPPCVNITPSIPPPTTSLSNPMLNNTPLPFSPFNLLPPRPLTSLASWMSSFHSAPTTIHTNVHVNIDPSSAIL
ncbi:unnamed protein product [Periconia digitata]|uniref:Uncharacterized protein n=1 Tax=Periconia digitata TaxID=1303443 RepID=A0A9W4U5L8_9PLEO|nr:unnamed protein product [Periconia digitata]